MKKNIKNIILVIVVLFLVIGAVKMIFFKGKTEITDLLDDGQEVSFKTIKPEENLAGISPKSVSYTTQGKITLDKKIPVYKINNQKIDDVFIKKITESFGFKEEAVISEENLIIYNNSENNTILDINKQTSTVKFSKNLLLYPMIKPMRVVSTAEITEKLRGLLIKNFGLEQKVKMKVERIEYETLAGPRFLTSTKEKGNIVKIVANYEVLGFPVFSSTGFPIIARFSTDGNLLNISVDLPFNNIVKQADFSVKTEDELKIIPAEQYKIIDVDGGKDYDLVSTEEFVDGVNITNGYLGYTYFPENKYLSPFVFFKSNSKLPSGPVVVILSVPALKQEEYYK